MTLALYVDTEGGVRDARVFQSSGHPLLDMSALNNAQLYWRFSRGVRNCKVSAMWFKINVAFTCGNFRTDGCGEPASNEAQNSAKQPLLSNKLRRERLVAEYGEDLGTAIASGEVRKGMTKEQVREARGEPDEKQVIPPNDEMWRY